MRRRLRVRLACRLLGHRWRLDGVRLYCDRRRCPAGDNPAPPAPDGLPSAAKPLWQPTSHGSEPPAVPTTKPASIPPAVPTDPPTSAPMFPPFGSSNPGLQPRRAGRPVPMTRPWPPNIRRAGGMLRCDCGDDLTVRPGFPLAYTLEAHKLDHLRNLGW